MLSIFFLAACNSKKGILVFTNGQPADVVVGQTSFSSGAAGLSASQLSGPQGVSYHANGLIITENTNHRVLDFGVNPVLTGAEAQLVLGQNSMTSNSLGAGLNQMHYPQYAAVLENRMFVSEDTGARITVWSPPPSASGTAATFVLGTAVSGCSATQFSTPDMIFFAAEKMVVADSGNNRVLIYNSIPNSNGVTPDLVLGQANFTTCSAPTTHSSTTLLAPSAIWTDGTKLIVSDADANRVLIWNNFPTQNNQAADVVIGQATFSASSSGSGAANLNRPWGVASDGTQLWVSDHLNHRVLIWNSIPTTNGAWADVVLGQPDFDTVTATTSQVGLNRPCHLALNLGLRQLAVSDYGNNRVLLYNSVDR